MRLALLSAISAGAILAADWNPRLAADYLDQRQKEWFEWPVTTASTGSTCISCHTNLTYMLVRPRLRRAIGETQPTAHETRFLDISRRRAEIQTPAEMFPKSKNPAQAAGVESILTAWILALRDPTANVTRLAFDRMWSLQVREGKAKGAWAFFELDLDPWETNGASPYFGAALAALAVAALPEEYRQRQNIRERISDLAGYLEREADNQPLHNRLFALWASTALRGALPEAIRKSIIEEVWRKQEPDGGWTLESLGPWQKREKAPPSSGSNAYATGLAALVLQKAGSSHAGLERALEWLRSHQNREGGFWEAISMNKPYPAGSMQIGFMRDAATSFAALALLEQAAVNRRISAEAR